MRTGGRCEVVQPFDLLSGQLDAASGGVLLYAVTPLGAGNRSDVVALREQPGQRHLGRCCSHLSGNGSDLVDDAQIALEVLAGKARVALAPVLLGELLGRADVPREKAVAEQLRRLITAGPPSQQIAKAVTWLKQNFVVALHGDDLADRAHMSPSTFRQHFRALTGLSPLQYQKQLRLQEARQLMLNQNLDAGSAAGRVGYESASQFSREYNRLFGAPPQRDIKRMRLI